MSRESEKLKALKVICDKLSERKAVLFLGAGINAGLVNSAGDVFPMGQQLSTYIARDLLGDENIGLTLDESAEIARYRLGEKELNEYLHKLFMSFTPGTAHLSLVQLPWDIIYTTNYDLLVESAAQSASIKPAGTIQAVCSSHVDLMPFKEEDILYYKLHGSVEIANTKEGKLTITKEDFRDYDLYRKPLFRRLEQDLLNRTFVFVGYALRDPNFRAILEDCRNILGIKSFPHSFAVRDRFSNVEESFWKEKYNIQLIESDSGAFLNDLKETWFSRGCTVIPFEDRKANQYLQVDASACFPKVGESFYRITPEDCTGAANPREFFRGAEPTWSDIREKVAPERDAYWALFDAIFPELSDPSIQPSAYLVSGPAGTGKTTLAYSLAYNIVKDFGNPALIHIPSTPLDTSLIGPLVDDKDPKRVVIVVRHAAEYISDLERFLYEAKSRSLPITVILEERKNQWVTAITNLRKHFAPPDFELGPLSHDEIEKILKALAKYRLLGKLTGAGWEYQVDHFKSLADKDLLVALRELTTEGTFDDIIRDEFERIPSALAQRAYVYVAALGQIDLPVRYEVLLRLLDIDYNMLRKEIFTPTEKVLISGEVVGGSRHNIGFTLRTRHPIIASVIFSTAARDDETKIEILNDILLGLDPGHHEDKKLLHDITCRRELVNTLESHDKRRAIYELLTTLLPDNPYVLQHRSILEKELHNPSLAVKYARRAVELKKDSQVLLNTLGLALEFEARSCGEPLKRQALLKEASKIFDDNIKYERTNPFGYIGKATLLKQSINDEIDEEKKALLQAEALSFLEDAFEITEESNVIASELALLKKELGRSEKAIALITSALKKKPNDDRLYDILIKLQFDKDPTAALEAALRGAKYNPTSWRIQRHIARLKRQKNEPSEAIKGYYEAAIRHHRGDPALMVELAAYLFMQGKIPDASRIFTESRNLNLDSYEKRKTRQIWKNDDGDKKIFDGKVKRIDGPSAFVIAIPENFQAHFYRTKANLSELKEGDSVKFWIGFNTLGSSAHII